jgi:hypothetical protein
VGGAGTGTTPRHSRTNSAVTGDMAANAAAGNSFPLVSPFSFYLLGVTAYYPVLPVVI